jgi:hypothetical protein
LFLQKLAKLNNIDEGTYNALSDMFEKNPKIVNSTDLIKISRCVSYMSFMLKELCDFYMAKSGGVPVYKIKSFSEEFNSIKTRCDKLENFLK